MSVDSQAAKPRPYNSRLPIVSGLLVAGLVALFLVWDWNWFKPLVERRASAALGRPVTLQRFNIVMGREPLLIAQGIRIANPANGFPHGSSLATIEFLRVRLDADALWHRKLRLPLIEVTQVDGDLLTDSEGKPNWKLLLPPPGTKPDLLTLELGRLAIHDSKLRLRDPSLKADFTVRFKTLPGKDGAEDSLVASFDGRYNGQALEGYFKGGSLLGLRDPARPYPVDARLDNGATQLKLKGSVERPLSFGGAHLMLSGTGPDMAALFPLTGIPFPQTPPYRVDGQLSYAAESLQLRNINGTVGGSDLAGRVDINLRGEKPSLKGELSSRLVNLGDLAGFIGAKPTGAPETAAEVERDRVLPDTPIDVPKLKAANIDIVYRAAQIRGNKTPLDELSAHVLLHDGRYSFQPLEFKVGKGEISTTLSLDANGSEPRLESDTRFKQVDSGQLLESASLQGGGVVGGRIALKSSGHTVAQMMGRGNGEVQLFMQGGDLSALLVSLAGLDLGHTVVSLLGLPSRTDLRCLVTDFGLSDGLLSSRLVLADTHLSNLRVDGTLNLKDEALDFRMKSEAKRFSIGSLNAPILLRGTLKNPSVRPDLGRLGAKAGLAAVAGTLLTPLGALLPTIQLGLGKDNDCEAMIAGVQQNAAAKVQLPPKQGRK